MTVIEIGRLLRGSTIGCEIGCKVSQLSSPAFGGLVRIPLDEQYQVFGIIHDIHIDDDGLVRQLVTADGIPEELIQDNRLNRNVPVEVSVIFTGYEMNGQISHLLPPRPPLTLDQIYLCTDADMVRFCAPGKFGYLRHVLRAVQLPVGELLAAHVQQVSQAQRAQGHPEWTGDAVRELITLLRDDYPTLMTVLGALADAALLLEE